MHNFLLWLIWKIQRFLAILEKSLPENHASILFYHFGIHSNLYRDCVVVGQPRNKINMVEKRYMASALTLNETTLWIVGGDGLFNVGTEFVTLDKNPIKGITNLKWLVIT